MKNPCEDVHHHLLYNKWFIATDLSEYNLYELKSDKEKSAAHYLSLDTTQFDYLKCQFKPFLT